MQNNNQTRNNEEKILIKNTNRTLNKLTPVKNTVHTTHIHTHKTFVYDCAACTLTAHDMAHRF